MKFPWIGQTPELISGKHWHAIGKARLLLDFFTHHQTDASGRVHYGKPITYGWIRKKIANCPCERTLKSYAARLKREGYIETRRVWDGYRSLGFKVRVLNQAKFAPPRQLGLFTPEVTEFSTAFSTERRGKAVGNLLKPAAAWGQEVAPLRGQEVAPRSKTDKSYETTNSIAPPARVTPPRWKSAKARQILAEIERYRAAYIGCSREDLEQLQDRLAPLYRELERLGYVFGEQAGAGDDSSSGRARVAGRA